MALLAAQEEQFWNDALQEDELEAVRSVSPQLPANVDPEMVWDIQRLIGRLIAQADKLLGERTGSVPYYCTYL